MLGQTGAASGEPKGGGHRKISYPLAKKRRRRVQGDRGSSRGGMMGAATGDGSARVGFEAAGRGSGRWC